jgi:hypothetical protein
LGKHEPPKGIAGPQVVARDVQPLITAHHVHHTSTIDAEMLRHATDLVGKADLERMEVIAGILEQFSAFPGENLRVRCRANRMLRRACRSFAIMGADSGERGIAKIAHGSAFTQEFGAVIDVQTGQTR